MKQYHNNKSVRVVVAGSDFHNYLNNISSAFQQVGCVTKTIPCIRPGRDTSLTGRLFYRLLPQYGLKIFYTTAWAQIRHKFLVELRNHQFDLFLAIRPDFLSPEMIDQIREQQPHAVLACWLMDPVARIPNIESVLQKLDFVFLYDAADVPEVKRYNDQAYTVILAYDPQDYFPPKYVSSAKLWELSFVGKLEEYRLKILEQFCQSLALTSQQVQIYGGEWKLLPLIGQLRLNQTSWLHAQNMIQLKTVNAQRACELYHQSKICLNIHQPGMSQGYNMRIFEIAGSAGFQLVERLPKLQEVFEDGREIEMYSSIEELTDKARYYLAHPKERHKIGLQGEYRANATHTFRHRVSDIIDVCGF